MAPETVAVGRRQILVEWRPTRAVSAVAVGLAAVIGVAVALLQPTLSWVLIGAVALALFSPIAIKAVRGTLDVFEPLVVANLALAAMFVVAPCLDIVLGNFDHVGYDVRVTFDQALTTALFGICAFEIGYAMPWGRAVAMSRSRPASEFSLASAARFAIVAALVGYALYGAFIVQSGGLSTVALFLSGRSGADNAIYLQSTGYLSQGLLLAYSGALLLLAIGLRRNSAVICFAAAITAAPLLIFAVATGSRADLLLVVGSATVLWYLFRRRRPGLLAVIVVALAFLLVSSYLLNSRTTGSELRSEGAVGIASLAANPGNLVLDTLSGSNDMFNSLANELTVVPSTVPFAPGSSITDLFVRAIPRPVWPQKPLERNDAVVVALWPAHYAHSRASSAFSVIGPFYADSGLIGVFVGMLLIGWAARTIWCYFLLNRDRFAGQLIYATVLPLTVVLMRGTLPDTLSRALFLVGPVLVCDFLLRKRIVLAPSSRIDHVRSHGRRSTGVPT